VSGFSWTSQTSAVREGADATRNARLTRGDQADGAADDSWNSKSYKITTEELTQYCRWVGTQCRSIPGGRKLLRDYQEHFRPIVELRLQQAGSRLADLLKQALQTQ